MIFYWSLQDPVVVGFSNRIGSIAVDLPMNHEVVWDNTPWTSQTWRLYHLQPRITTCTSAMSHGALKEIEENPQQQRKGKAKGRGMLSQLLIFRIFRGKWEQHTYLLEAGFWTKNPMVVSSLAVSFSWPHMLLELKFPEQKTQQAAKEADVWTFVPWWWMNVHKQLNLKWFFVSCDSWIRFFGSGPDMVSSMKLEDDPFPNLGYSRHLFRSLLVAVSFKEFLSLPRGKKILRMYKSPKGCEMGSTTQLLVLMEGILQHLGCIKPRK